ncbi:tripartite tricarboxylate transporter substrate binding protein [Methylocella sp. CPCC 101449]|uniref:Bug family tripartite tricarboxylate transporter substrate binding protein n=1 Tax=Methylocella sp. CPCC 101449 TaxID=2987531 RepID=UPI002891E7D8|nr:tripartite tricarboxylate transporter substrate binding protein [Methylocella sp. CPCC 101449]MDT2023861.1 tripartite tricarboxylate transporter substrate binding protein [Methylocella sp. CPCC 101449]
MGCIRLLGGILLAITATQAEAQDSYPNRPIRLIVGFTAGGPTDTPARLIAEKLRTSLGQSIVVENRPGAGGKIALDYVLSQPRDGYTLSLCTYIDATNTVLLKNPGYALADLAPISQITKAYYAFAVPTALPVQDLASFAAHAKAKPGALNYGHVGAGSMPELVAKRFEQAAGVKMTGVPYKGTAEASMDLAGGRLDFMVAPLIVVQPLLDAGSVKYIGMTSPERLTAFPNVPTAVEQGYRITDNGWLGVCAGAGVPAEIIARLNREVGQAVASPAYRELVEKTGVMPYAGSVDEFRQLVTDTETDMRKLARELGLEAK